MMVLVVVAIGAGWLYSLGVTPTGGGAVFDEAATVLAAFVLLGRWFEMRPRWREHGQEVSEVGSALLWWRRRADRRRSPSS